MKLAFPKRQAGASLLEVLAYLGVASLIITGAISMYNSAQTSSATEQITREMVTIRSGIRSLYGSQLGASISHEALIRAGIFPSTIKTDLATGRLTHLYGGDVSVYGLGGQFFISYEDIPSSVCTKVISRAGANWKAVEINYWGTYYTNNGPMPLDEITLRCSDDDTAEIMVYGP